MGKHEKNRLEKKKKYPKHTHTQLHTTFNKKNGRH
jgi:hypothetical protein